MKVKVMIESFGERVRLSLSPGQGEIANTLFANLLWVLGWNGDAESFIVERERLASAVKSFRAGNMKQPRRGKGLWKSAPFAFSLVEQRNDTREVASGKYDIGNANYQNATDSEFTGFQSRLAMGNAEV